MANKRAMVIGCKGMDGSHMVDLLNSKGYEVWGISRHDEPHNIKRYAKQVDEIYNFAGKSDVINPFDNVNELEDIWKIPLTVLEAIKDTGFVGVRFFNAGSPLSISPTTPYGAAKKYAHELIKMYRERYCLFAVNGIMYPHVSERQKDHFFSKKIIKAAATKTIIEVNYLGGQIDYGYAPDYVEAAYMTLHGRDAMDYTIATGRRILLRSFAGIAFEYVNKYYGDYVIEKNPDHTSERHNVYEQPNWSGIYNDLGWVPKTRIEDAIKLMIDNYGKN